VYHPGRCQPERPAANHHYRGADYNPLKSEGKKPADKLQDDGVKVIQGCVSMWTKYGRALRGEHQKVWGSKEVAVLRVNLESTPYPGFFFQRGGFTR
jgi:hypothetical protein